MKFTDSRIANSDGIDKTIAKSLLFIDQSTEAQGFVKSNDPIFRRNSGLNSMNPDIRYKSLYQNDALNHISFRNSLFLFAENNEIDKALRIYCNEIVVSNLKNQKYPVYPRINPVFIEEDKLELVKVMQEYLDDIFYPKLWRWLGFDENKGLSNKLREFMITGKLAFEKVYDNIKRPKEITNIYPIDPSCLSKFRKDFQTWYIYRDPLSNTEKILHESQVILIEYNKYDFGYISHVDKVRRDFNIMRGMQTSKIGWFAAKSQVRLHINMNLADMSREDAENHMRNEESELFTTYEFDEINGVMLVNGEPQALSYQEIVTAESQNSGKAEVDEIVGNGPDLTEVDSLQYFEKKYWASWEIPYDRVDPSSTETWSFNEPSQVKKSEINFSKNCLDIKDLFSEIFLDAIITQFTLQEAEIGVDLSLLDSITMDWVTFNEYEKPAELETLAKQFELATQISTFGEAEDAEGRTRKLIPYRWIMENYIDFSPEAFKSLEKYQKLEDIRLGFIDKNGNPIPVEDEEDNEDDFDDPNFDPDDEEIDSGFEDDDIVGISNNDDNEY